MRNFRQTFATLFVTSFAFCSFGYAAALDDATEAKKLQGKIENAVLSLDGVNGVGIVACDPRTGRQVSPGQSFVHCVGIGADAAGYRLLSQLYPQGINVKGVYITVFPMGPMTPQPRVSGSN